MIVSRKVEEEQASHDGSWQTMNCIREECIRQELDWTDTGVSVWSWCQRQKLKPATTLWLDTPTLHQSSVIMLLDQDRAKGNDLCSMWGIVTSDLSWMNACSLVDAGIYNWRHCVSSLLVLSVLRRFNVKFHVSHMICTHYWVKISTIVYVY